MKHEVNHGRKWGCKDRLDSVLMTLRVILNDLVFYLTYIEGILQSVKQDIEIITFKLLTSCVENEFEECKSGERVTRKTHVRCNIEKIGNSQTNVNFIYLRNFKFILPETENFRKITQGYKRCMGIMGIPV